MAADTRTWVAKIAAATGGRPVVVGIHLIYGLAIPCAATGLCLEYHDTNLVDEYIKPAAARGWTVILDTQLGRSDPAAEVKRMLDRGYLRYDNVHVAIDPEFHLVPGNDVPGIPIGTSRHPQINDVQRILTNTSPPQIFKTKKILIVHQFGDRAVHDGVPLAIRPEYK